jgi:hypothetical protein
MKDSSTQIQTKGLTRNPIDKFYTKKSVVELCGEKIRGTLQIDEKNDLIIEPSAGNGAFINIIKTLCNNYKYYDIKPDNPVITQQDFLKLDLNSLSQKKKQKIHLIGNPPFGRQSSLAIKFIRHSALFCDSISFILPRSFKKQSMQDKVPLLFHCVCEIDLPFQSFLLNDKDHDVPCIFQIWEKKETERILKEKLIPKNFEFVKKDEKNKKPNISFRRVGINAGYIDTDIDSKSKQSHYFIKFKNGFGNEELLQKLGNIKFKNSDHTVGPKSISKQELIEEFMRLI